ncbi:hypothetical protein [Cerasicoccus arenae]|uniref:Uncharacterized protein n=1 Tax=Cerasicoccus arenae TaxID=424488 RepID=A0A8J3DDT7_9BACT|nr:hypothetical protein [Cerasicoccus arenae]MBK1859021.1 hypothetical protein [Cerasicoccus arenae]GHB94763.1 hypothetical protein GCM10007047_07870 [Cerasicoccus arenae]
MAKVDIDLVKMVMTRTGMDVRTVAQVIEEINQELKAQVDEEDKPPPIKKQFVMMVSDPDGKLEGLDLVGWVLQIPEEDSPYVSEERLFRCAYEYNMTKKGRRMPVKTIGEACEFTPARIAKEQKVWIKNKEPVLLVRTGGKVPTETKDGF